MIYSYPYPHGFIPGRSPASIEIKTEDNDNSEDIENQAVGLPMLESRGCMCAAVGLDRLTDGRNMIDGGL